MCILLYEVVLTFDSVDEILKYYNSFILPTLFNPECFYNLFTASIGHRIFHLFASIAVCILHNENYGVELLFGELKGFRQRDRSKLLWTTYQVNQVRFFK